MEAFQKSLLSIFENLLGLIFEFNLKPWSENQKAYFFERFKIDFEFFKPCFGLFYLSLI
jgi:hypothetical protein